MSRKRIAGPVIGTIAYEALKEVLSAGGLLESSALERLIPSRYRSASRFTQIIANPLSLCSLAYEVNGVMKITPKGRKFLKQDEIVVQAEPISPENIAQYRSAPPFRPLDISKIMAAAPIRPGMNDYSLIPSLTGSARRRFRGNRE